MKPLIVAATTFEIQDSIPLLEEKGIPYVVTGVGMTATAHQLTKALLSQRVDFVLNVGIAGSVIRELSIGEVVAVETDHFYELGAEDGDRFLSIEEMGFGQATYRSCRPKDISLPLPAVAAITVNKVHGNEKSIQTLKEHLPHIAVESMEGAAVLYVCEKEGIPCCQVRAISNYVERRNKEAWNIPLAIANLNRWLRSFVENNY